MTAFLAIVIVILAITAIVSHNFYLIAVDRADKSFLSGDPALKGNAGGEHLQEHNIEWWEKQSVEEWHMAADDGTKLHAYYLAADEPSGKTVILAHGYTGYAEQMGVLAKMYKDSLGYNVLMPDARGHGRSEGNYIGFGWPERKDYLKWIARVIERSGQKSQIVLHGISMGAATVMMTCGEHLPDQVKAIVEDCGYTSVRDELAFQMKRMYRLPAFPFLYTTSLLTKLRAGYFFGEASALKQIRKSKIPILFIHGESDTFVPTRMVYELYESSPAEKKLYIAPDAGHGLARFVDPERYDREVTEFLAKHIKERATVEAV